jgi:hypothetical protein
MYAPLTLSPLSAAGMQHEIVTLAVPLDERIWVPQEPGVWFLPLMLNTVSGGWFNLLRVRKRGVLSRHRHPMAVYGVRHQRQLALPGARLGRHGRRIRVRAARRSSYVDRG